MPITSGTDNSQTSSMNMEAEMQELELECPVCGETLGLDQEAFEHLGEGELLECEVCSIVVELISLDPLEVRVVEDGHYYVDCPRCETQISLGESGPVTCPECSHTFDPDWSEVDEEAFETGEARGESL